MILLLLQSAEQSDQKYFFKKTLFLKWTGLSVAERKLLSFSYPLYVIPPFRRKVPKCLGTDVELQTVGKIQEPFSFNNSQTTQLGTFFQIVTKKSP